MISTEARDCQALIGQLKAKHKQIALQWIPGHCQMAGNEHADALAKKGAKITQTHNNNNNNNNNNTYLLQLGCYPVAVVILHVYKT